MTSELDDIKRVVIENAFSEEEVQQRVNDARIGLALGWTWAPDKSHDGRVMDWNTWYDDEGAQRGRCDHPRYHESLDACATAEARLPDYKRGAYVRHIWAITKAGESSGSDQWFTVITATPAQRSAALLAVLKGGK